MACKSCNHCGTWKGMGTHGVDHGRHAMEVPMCNHENGAKREILNPKSSFLPGWCPLSLSEQADLK